MYTCICIICMYIYIYIYNAHTCTYKQIRAEDIQMGSLGDTAYNPRMYGLLCDWRGEKAPTRDERACKLLRSFISALK